MSMDWSQQDVLVFFGGDELDIEPWAANLKQMGIKTIRELSKKGEAWAFAQKTVDGRNLSEEHRERIKWLMENVGAPFKESTAMALRQPRFGGA